MKKLFLYLIIFCFIFWSGYFISNDIFKNYEPSFSTTQTTADTEATSEVTEEPSIAEAVLGEQIDAQAKTTRYIVGISNGYVTVYKNDLNTVYEYTGINAINVQMNDDETYYKLCNKIYFEDIDELYAFLQSIAN
ncbi:MAG: hypothetical protein ACI4D8_00200 [Wujia sp.]